MLQTFADYAKLKDGDPVSPYSSPAIEMQSADTDGEDNGLGDLGSPGMGKKLSPLEPVKNRAQPEFSKSGKLKNQHESTINEARDDDLNFMRSHTGEKFTPSLAEVTSYVGKLAKNNPNVHERLIRDFKRHGSFEPLMNEMMNHGETFDMLAGHFGHKENGRKHAKKLVGACKSHRDSYMKDHFGGFNESVDAPRGDSGLGSSMAPTSMPSGNSFPMASPMPSPAPMASEPNSMGYGSNFNGSSMGAPPALNLPPSSATESTMKFGHDHLLDAMSGVPEFKSKMMECCGY